MRASRLCAALALALWVASLAGCMLPGAMAVADRLPSPDLGVGPEPWQVVSAADLVGSFESVEICGDAAASVIQITYCFETGGRYTAEAVLVFADGPAARQVSGTWKLVSGRLHLGHGSEPARIQTDGNRLRLTTSLGMVILERKG